MPNGDPKLYENSYPWTPQSLQTSRRATIVRARALSMHSVRLRVFVLPDPARVRRAHSPNYALRCLFSLALGAGESSRLLARGPCTDRCRW